MKHRKLLLIGILFVALFLRIFGVWQSLWLDESISAVVAKTYSHTYIWKNFVLADTHPPLYYSMLRVWTQLFGYSEFSLRLPSILFGLTTVFVTYFLAKKFLKEKESLIATSLMATSGLAIYYSQEARMYSMTAMLVSLLCLFYLSKKWLVFSLILVLLAMTDYLPLTICFVFLIYPLFTTKKVSDFKILVLSALPAFIFILSFYKIIYSQSLSTITYLAKNPWWGTVLGTASVKSLGLVWVKFLIGRIDFENIYVYSSVLAVVTVVAGYLLLIALRSYKNNLFFLLWLVLPLTISFLASFRLPGFSYFRLTFLLPAFYILLASGISEAKYKKQFTVAILIINLATSLLYLTNTRYWREDWKTLVPTIENELKVGEVVVVDFVEPFTPYLWYSTKPKNVVAYSKEAVSGKTSLYTLDYLMDVTDPEGQMFFQLKNSGFKERKVYNFRGAGQVRYWTRF